MHSTTSKFKAAIIVLLVLAGVAWAAAVVSTQQYPDFKRGFKDAVASADAAELTSTTYVEFIDLTNRMTITIAPTFSASGATAAVYFVRGYVDDQGTFKPKSTTSASFTASSVVTIGARYVANSASFDTAGYPKGFLSVSAISAGTVDVEWSLH